MFQTLVSGGTLLVQAGTAAGQYVAGCFRPWDHRISAVISGGLMTLTLDGFAKLVGIAVGLGALYCSLDRRMAEKRIERLRLAAILAGDRRLLAADRRAGGDGRP